MKKQIKLSEDYIRNLAEAATKKALKEGLFSNDIWESEVTGHTYNEEDETCDEYGRGYGTYYDEDVVEKFFQGNWNLAAKMLEELSRFYGTDSVREMIESLKSVA